MAVTDLTNTKWLINSTTCTAGYGQFSVDHTCTPDYQGGTIYIGYTYDIRSGATPTANVVTLMGSLHELEANDVLEITGGTDVTNSNLITWLTANATQITSGGAMYIGNSTISKMYIGQNEVEKVYLGQDLVYEKQAPSGFTVQITTSINDSIEANNALYSLDDGATWVTLYDEEAYPSKTITLNNVTQIKFKVGNPNLANWGVITSNQLSLNISGNTTSQNYVLTQDITDIRAYTYYD